MTKVQRIGYTELAASMRTASPGPLPGLEVQLRMAPLNRRDEIRAQGLGRSPTKSSVLLLLYPGEDGNPYMAFIRRPLYDGAHSGQIAFPGGRFEASDSSLRHTALRESREEVGVDPGQVEVVAELSPLYIPPSNYIVSPFVGLADQRPHFVPDKKEVDSILELPLSAFMHRENRMMKPIMLSTGQRLETPCYAIDGHIIWGATAMIMAEFLEVTKRILDK